MVSAMKVDPNNEVAYLKTSLPVWEDFVSKSNKMQISLKHSIGTISAFLESFQKIADLAMTKNYGINELGSNMTKFRLRQRELEQKLREFENHIGNSLSAPLNLRIEEWKRNVAQMDKDFNKESKRIKEDLKRSTMEAEKWQKRLQRRDSSVKPLSNNPCSDYKNLISGTLNFAEQDLITKRKSLDNLNQNTLKRVATEERRRFIELVTCLRPVLSSYLNIFRDYPVYEELIPLITSFAENNDPSDNILHNEFNGISPYHHGNIANNNEDIYNTTILNGTINNKDYKNSNNFSDSLSLTSSTNSNHELKSNGNYVSSTNYGHVSSGVHSGSPSSNNSLNVYSSTIYSPTIQQNGQVNNNKKANASSPANYDEPVPIKELLNNSIGKNHLSETDNQRYQLIDETYATDIDLLRATKNDQPLKTSIQHSFPHGNQPVEHGVKDNVTTEDTAGESTEDDLDDVTQSNQREENSALYPDQCLPPPVYTNLKKLEKVATRKFSLCDTTQRAIPFEQDLLQMNNQSHKDDRNHSSQEQTIESNVNLVPTSVVGMIDTQINCGTSTFKRRQNTIASIPMSSYSIEDSPKSSPSHKKDSYCNGYQKVSKVKQLSRQMSHNNSNYSTHEEVYASKTPGTVRRNSRLSRNEAGCIISPPRRSSSMSRELAGAIDMQQRRMSTIQNQVKKQELITDQNIYGGVRVLPNQNTSTNTMKGHTMNAAMRKNYSYYNDKQNSILLKLRNQYLNGEDTTTSFIEQKAMMPKI